MLDAALLRMMEGGGEIEDRLALLDRGDPARGEGPPVAHPLHLVHDRHPGDAGAQEVRVQRVDRAVALHGAPRGHQRLAGDLPAEDPLEGLLRAGAAEDVDLDLLQIEQIDQSLGGVRHQRISTVGSGGSGGSCGSGGSGGSGGYGGIRRTVRALRAHRPR